MCTNKEVYVCVPADKFVYVSVTVCVKCLCKYVYV